MMSVDSNAETVVATECCLVDVSTCELLYPHNWPVQQKHSTAGSKAGGAANRANSLICEGLLLMESSTNPLL